MTVATKACNSQIKQPSQCLLLLKVFSWVQIPPISPSISQPNMLKHFKNLVVCCQTLKNE